MKGKSNKLFTLNGSSNLSDASHHSSEMLVSIADALWVL